MYSFDEKLKWVEGFFSDPKFMDGIPEERSGVYIVYVRNRPVNRFFGTDVSGILYVGQSSKIGERIKNFPKGISKGAGHSGANPYHTLGLAGKMHLEDLCVKYHLTSDVVDSIQVEDNILKEYLSVHLELPPFNNKSKKEKNKRVLALIFHGCK